MSEVGAAAAQRHREHMRSKARRLGDGEDAKSVDSSSFTPGEPLDADAKTGMRPVSRQARAAGGRIGGFCAGGRADRPARAKGGGLGGESYVNRNAKQANEDRAGRKHDMGLKKGGRAHKAGGGLGALGGLLPMAISEMGGDKDKDADALGPTAAAVGKANGGGINADKGVYKPDKEREGATRTRELKRASASSAVETRMGRASGGRVAKQGGGPLAEPLAAGMGGQGRFNFNFPGNRAQMLADGGRARAHARYGAGPGPAEHHPGMAKAAGGRTAEDRQFDEDARETLGQSQPNWSSRSGFTKSAPKPRGRGARAAGGEVAKKALAAHHAEHAAMRDGKAAGGSISEDPPSYGRAQARQDRAQAIAQKAAFRAAGKSKAGGGPVVTLKGTPPAPKKPTFTAAQAQARDKQGRRAGGRSGHPEGCECSRCTASKAKGGLLSKWTAEQKAAGGQVGPGPAENKPTVTLRGQPQGYKKPTFTAAQARARDARARGGKASKGTKINIIVAPGGMGQGDGGAPGGMPPNLALKPPPAAPVPMPMPPGGAPPPAAGAPMPMPVPMPMPGGGGPPGMPPRARGGRAPQVRGEPEAGSGSGLGRLQKIEEYGHRSREGAGLRK